MTQINVDSTAARGVLTRAIALAKSVGYVPSHPKKTTISEVMLGKHLTYRYVLITNLLAKATNPKINALALQAGADLDGAFDSRSLCHGVIVPADRKADELAGKLGRSNEPYLNKPARFPALTVGNAVRRGYDKNIRDISIDILGGLNDQADAFAAVTDAIYFTLQRDSLVAEAATLVGDATLHEALTGFGSALVLKSMEGETCAILTALAFHIFGRGQDWSPLIKVHPVNQAGSSSNEVLDIDVYVDLVIDDDSVAKKLRYSAEVKDKPFTTDDVDHAATKAGAAGLSGFFFICGPKSGGALSGAGFVPAIAEKGIKVAFVDVEQFLAMALGFAPDDLDGSEVWAFIDASMTAARVKDDTRKHVLACAREAGLISVE